MKAYILYDTSVKEVASLAEAHQVVEHDSEPATIVTEMGEIRDQLSGPEMVTLYNGLVKDPSKHVAKFASRGAGAKRIWATINQQEDVAMSTKKHQPKKKSSEPQARRARLQMSQVLVVGANLAREQSVYGTLQHLVKEAKSITVEELMKQAKSALKAPRAKVTEAYMRRTIALGVANQRFVVK